MFSLRTPYDETILEGPSLDWVLNRAADYNGGDFYAHGNRAPRHDETPHGSRLYMRLYRNMEEMMMEKVWLYVWRTK